MSETRTKAWGEVLADVYRAACPDGRARHSPLSLTALEAVAAHVRAEDAARGGTLSEEEVEDWLAGIAAHGDVTPLRVHLSAQGRAIAEKDARIAELEKERDGALERVEELGRLKDGERTLRHKADVRQRAAESALATLRQATGNLCRLLREDMADSEPTRLGENTLFALTYAEGVLYAAAPTPVHPDTATLRAIRERAGDVDGLCEVYAVATGRVFAQASSAPALAAVSRWILTGDSGTGGSGCGDTSDQCPRGGHHVAEHERGGKHPLCGAESILVPTTPPDTGATNTCEHGDHPAPQGRRFCSPECEECEGAKMTCHRCMLVAALGDSGPSGGGDTFVAPLVTEHPQYSGRIHLAEPTTPPDTDATAPTPTPEEDWRTLAALLEACGTDAQKSALMRLRDEPHRAAEAMRERCAAACDAEAKGLAGQGRDAEADAVACAAERIRALPLE